MLKVILFDIDNTLLSFDEYVKKSIKSGIQFGMQTCFYNPDKKTIPCGMKINYNVSSLKEIENIL